MLDVPMPEDDGISDDEFDGYLDADVSDQMLDNIVEQTNLYAQQYMESTNLPPNSRAHGWSHSPFNRAELKKFLAMTITMGIVSYPEMEDYWSTSWPYATPAFSKVCVILCSSQYPRLSCPGTPPLSFTHAHTLSLSHTHIYNNCYK